MSHPSRRARAASTAWTSPDWYLGMVGRRGHRFHRAVALPALLALLPLRPGDRVLDVGCGPGVPAPHVARRGARYTGVDASPAMIAAARRHHGDDGEFRLGDARDLRAALGRPGPDPARFDHVVFLFSLQDMDPLDGVLREAARVLRPGGTLVAVLTHPCFRVPRASGWGWDADRRLHFRRVDRYLSAGRVASGPPGSRSASFHRPLEAYFAALASAGLAVDALREFAPPPAPRGAAEPGNADIPALLAWRARRG